MKAASVNLQEWTRCKQSVAYWATNYLWVREKNGRIAPLFPYQKRMLANLQLIRSRGR